MLAGAGPPYATSLVGGVAEAERVSSDVLGEAVVALGAGVGVAGGDRGEDGWPPGLDGLGEPVRLGDVAGGGLLVEPPEPVVDELAVRVRRQREQGAQLFLDGVGVQHLGPGSPASISAFQSLANASLVCRS